MYTFSWQKNNAKTYKKEMMQSVSCIINQYKSK